MKIGIRKPSPTRSVKARTTGRVKKKIKGSVNPFYGKKGIGYLTDPERAIKNKIYHKVTIDPLDGLKKKTRNAAKGNASAEIKPTNLILFPMILFYLLGIILGAWSVYTFLAYKSFNAIGICAFILCFVLFVLLYRRKYE